MLGFRDDKIHKYALSNSINMLQLADEGPVVKIDCSKRLAFLLYDFKLISNQQQLISKTDIDVNDEILYSQAR